MATVDQQAHRLEALAGRFLRRRFASARIPTRCLRGPRRSVYEQGVELTIPAAIILQLTRQLSSLYLETLRTILTSHDDFVARRNI